MCILDVILYFQPIYYIMIDYNSVSYNNNLVHVFVCFFAEIDL